MSLNADDVSALREFPTYLRTSGMLLSIAFYNLSYIFSYLSSACNMFSVNEVRLFSPFQKRRKRLTSFSITFPKLTRTGKSN